MSVLLYRSVGPVVGLLSTREEVSWWGNKVEERVEKVKEENSIMTPEARTHRVRLTNPDRKEEKGGVTGGVDRPWQVRGSVGRLVYDGAAVRRALRKTVVVERRGECRRIGRILNTGEAGLLIKLKIDGTPRTHI